MVSGVGRKTRKHLKIRNKKRKSQKEPERGKKKKKKRKGGIKEHGECLYPKHP